MFIGENLTNLRMMHGYSRKQLSELLGVTEQAIWQYENNYTSPKLQVVNELKHIFQVKSKYFYYNDALKRYINPKNIQITNIAYRSKVLHVISKTQSEAKHVAFLDALVNYLTYNVSLPTKKIIQLKKEVMSYLNNNKDDKIIQIYKTAKLARQSLGLSNDSNDDMMFLMEKSGIFIFEKSIGDEIDAYSLWTNNNRPFIILGNLKRSAVRRNFDLAHELGHLLLHHHIEFTNLDRKEHKEIEKEANLFAGAFLLPEEPFIEDMKSVSYITNPDAYIDLKKKWKTSLQVLGFRAANLGIMDAKQHRNFYAALHRKKYLKREPLDEDLPIQKPQKIKTIIDFVIKNGFYDFHSMVEKDWMVESSFFHRLTGIDMEFFNRYAAKDNDFELYQVQAYIPNRN